MKGRKKGTAPPVFGDGRRHSPSDKDYELIWGRQPVREALAGQVPLLRIFIQEGSAGPIITEIKQRAVELSIPLEPLPRVKLDSMVKGESHQGLVAHVAPYRYHDVDELLEQAGLSNTLPFLLVLDHLQDPHNLGSLLRTAAAAGVDGVILPRDRACGITPAVYKTSAGNVIHLSVARVVNIGREIDRLKAEGYWIAGADMSGAQPFYDAELPFPLVLVLGAEGKGISRLVREKCDLLLRIPMAKEVMSLNVSVAGGIIIYDIYRRRASKEKRGN